MKKHIISVLLLLSIIISTTAPISYASSSLTVKDVSSGGFFNAVILSDDSLWMWGEWFYIGPEPQGDGSIPEKIMTDVKDVSCGRAHTMILKNNGDLYVMGLYGGLGLSDIVGSDSCLTVPTKIMSNVKYIDAGGGESCAVTTDGSLYVWYDDFEENATTKPEKVMSNVVSATVGEGYWLAVKNDNTLWACGENNYGQLGDGTTQNRETPVKIMDNVKFVDTAYWGWSSTAAIKTDSTLWTWGLNHHGQLGNNGYFDKQVDVFDFRGELYDTYDIVASPKKILDNVRSVQSAPQYMCAVLENGNLYEWGALEWQNHFKTPVYVMNNAKYAENANGNGIALKNNASWLWGRSSILYSEPYDAPIQYDVLNAKSIIPVTSVYMLNKAYTVNVGQWEKIFADCSPSNATNRNLKWSSSNSRIATVNDAGIVTGKSEGTVTITAKSSNGKSASCTVNVVGKRVFSFEDYKYNFPNDYDSFGYPYHYAEDDVDKEHKISDYRIPIERYTQVGIPIAVASYLHLRDKWGGSCFGMSASSILFYRGDLKAEKYEANYPIRFNPPNTNSKNDKKLREMIELFQVSQYQKGSVLGYDYTLYDEYDFSADEIMSDLALGQPVLLSIRNNNGDGHAVVIYDYSKNGNSIVFDIYDCSNFVSALTIQDNKYGFTYEDNKYKWYISSYTPYASIHYAFIKLRDKNHSGAASLFSLKQETEPTYTYIFRAAENLTIINSLGQTSTISNGELLGEIDDAKLIPSSYLAAEPSYTIILPTDTYTIVGSSDEVITTSFANECMSASVTAKSSTPITISSDLKEISVNAATGEEYDITYTTYDNIFDEMSLSGMATGTLTTKLNDADILISGVDTLTASASVSDSVVSTNSDSLADSNEITVKCEEADSGATIQILSADVELTDKTSLPERLTVDTPAYDLASGTYTEGQVLTFTKDDETIIYYTTDGSIPSADNGIIYSLPIDINKAMTVKAISTKYGYLDSEIVELNYTLPEVDMPQANIESGEYDRVITVELSTGNYEDAIYYTLDGSSSLENGILYTVPINISEDTYLQAYTLRNGCISEISEYEYTVAPTYPFYFSNSLTNQDGEIITPDNIADVTKVKMTLSKLHTGDHTGVFLIAFYGTDNRLIYVNYKTATISEDIDEVEIDITEDVSSAYKVKAFAWKDLLTIQPICEALEENIIIE